MIRIKKKENPDKGKPYKPFLYDLFIDGKLMAGVEIMNFDEDKTRPRYMVQISGQEAFEKVTFHSLAQLPKSIDIISIGLKFDWTDVFNHIWIAHPRRKKSFYLAFFAQERKDWKQSYSFWEYHRELRRIIRKSGRENIEVPESRVDKFAIVEEAITVHFLSPSLEIPIINELERCENILKELHELTEKALAERPKPKTSISNSIVMSFDFPQVVRVPCQQYLLYFAQFLRDLGIEANTSLVQDAGKVLFTVTPTNKTEALHKIAAALDYYLDLPTSPISADTDDEIAVQRLESTVLRLQSDLKLASAELQAKNATIEAQQLTINVQKGLLHGEIVVGKDVTPKPKEEDREEILGGVAALTVYKKGGAEISLAKLYRHLKEWIAGKE